MPDFPVLLAIWLGFAAIAGVIAYVRGDSNPAGYVGLGLLLGPFAILAAAIARPNRDA